MKISFTNMIMTLNIFNMDEHTRNTLIESNMVYSIYIDHDDTSFANDESIFKQIFKDKLRFLDELHTPTLYIMTLLRVYHSLMSKVLRIYLGEEIQLLCELEGPPHFTFHDPLNHGELFTS